MSLNIYNTLSRKKEIFEPLDKSNVRIYVCGPTVYQNAHIGNARPVIFFDVLAQLLRYFYPRVTYVRNITDVDDKINQIAQNTGKNIRDITNETVKVFHQDMRALGDKGPDFEPRATEHIPEMIHMINSLIEKNYAYAAQGHVLFHVPSMARYGELSRRNREDLIAGARVEVAPYKKDPSDFVLWKPSEGKTPGWDSPWGFGRPGWHIECSAMSAHYLGQEFDIHGGGQDLIFPHHENEIAQSQCANDTKSFAKYWIHNGYVTVEGEKMSKSAGNYYTVNELLEEFPGEALRLMLLKTHYRQPLDFTKEGVREAKRELDRFYLTLKQTDVPNDGLSYLDPDQQVIEALKNDLNVPQAITELHRIATSINAAKTQEMKISLAQSLLISGNLMGLFYSSPDSWLKWQPSALLNKGFSAKKIDLLIKERNVERAKKNYDKSDEIRDILQKQGVTLEDGPSGTTWRRE